MKNSHTFSRICGYAMFLLILAQIVLVLASWLITAAMPDVFPRSLLSPEGIRWFFGNVGEDAKAARQLVWAFKDSRDSAYEEVAQMTAKHLKEEYGEKVKSMVLVCVPTSKKENYQSRYMMFCNRVSELTGIGNGFSHVCVLQDRLDVHNHRRGKKKTERQAQLIDLDTYYFKDKEICVFDDVVTTGKSYADFANKLEDSGAHVLGGMFLGKTYYRYNRQ